MPVLMLVAAVVILAGVVVVASGRGGEMVTTEPDYPPIDLGPVTSADVALLRPPSAAWGYNMRVTDEALDVIAKAVTERDVHIAALEQEVSDLRDQLGGGGRAATLEPSGGDPEPDWAGYAEDTAPAGPAVPITRPEPIYRTEDHGADEVHFGPGFGPADESEPPTQTPAPPSAPWGPAEPPDQEPLWEPAHPHEVAADHAISWEAPEAPVPEAPAAEAPAPEPPAPETPAPETPAPETPAPETPAPEAEYEPPADPGGETSVPVTPANGWRAQEPSVWDEASRQVEQEQTGIPSPVSGPEQARPARNSGPHEFHWDADPHQRVVWGAEHARAKAAKVTEQTLPNAEHPNAEHPSPEAPGAEPSDDDRG